MTKTVYKQDDWTEGREKRVRVVAAKYPSNEDIPPMAAIRITVWTREEFENEVGAGFDEVVVYKAPQFQIDCLLIREAIGRFDAIFFATEAKV